MAFKASIYLPITLVVLLIRPASGFAASIEADVTEAMQKKDWPSLVLLIQPRKGQNFEHDLSLAKALLSLERRQEALKLLSSLQETHKDERVTKLLQTAGTLFFAQETSNLYYEALEMISELRFTEAKERLEQAVAREPGHILLLSRLIQVQLMLGLEDAAAMNLKAVQASELAYPEWKLFGAKLQTDQKPSDEDGDLDLYRELHGIKSNLLENEVTATYWVEAVRRDEDADEMTILALKTVTDHPLWSYALLAIVKSDLLSPAIREKLTTQIQKNLKSREAFQTALATEMKRTQNLWVGYVNYEVLQAQLLTALPTPTASTHPKLK